MLSMDNPPQHQSDVFYLGADKLGVLMPLPETELTILFQSCASADPRMAVFWNSRIVTTDGN